MTRHTHRGVRASLWVDDGFGRLSRITYAQLLTRIDTGWGEL
jgi:hypothetical protein